MKYIIKDYFGYDLGGRFDGYCIETIQDEEMIEVFLYHKQCGVKSLIFKSIINSQTDWEMRELIDNNIEEYIATYTEKFMDDHYCENKI